MDPILSQLSQVALDKVVTNTGNPASSSGVTGSNSPFAKILDQQNASEDWTKKLMDTLNKTIEPTNYSNNTVDASSVSVKVEQAGEVSSTVPDAGHFVDILRNINADNNQMSKFMDTVRSGKNLSVSELMSAQFQMNNLNSMTEVFTRIGDGVNRAIQTTMQTQI